VTLARFFLLFASSALVSAAPTPASKQKIARQVIARLDVTSFPNSIGPRRQKGKKTFADYGFKRVTMTRNGADLIQAFGDNDDWLMSIEVLRASSSEILICLQDKAENGGTYNSVEPISVRVGHQRLWRGVPLKHSVPGCKIYLG